MKIVYILLAVSASLLFLALVFTPLERMFPARKQAILRPKWLLDLCFFLGQFLLWNSLVLLFVMYIHGYISQWMPDGFIGFIDAQPIWLQAVEVLVLSDFFIYWAHRLQHRNAFLWRFHKVHHSSEHLDWLAAHREHPLDTIYTVTIINLPAMMLGFESDALAGIIAFRGIWAVYIHSNVRMPLKWVRWLIGAPELHHWHHAIDRKAGNYANISPLMDLLFGTYICPDREPEKLGIEEDVPNTYLGHMLLPFKKTRLKADAETVE